MSLECRQSSCQHNMYVWEHFLKIQSRVSACTGRIRRLIRHHECEILECNEVSEGLIDAHAMTIVDVADNNDKHINSSSSS